MGAIIGVNALEKLNNNSFKLRTYDELFEEKLGWRQKLILEEYAARPLDKPIRVTDVETKLDLTSMQAARTLDSLVEYGNSAQMLTKYKTVHLIEYQRLIDQKKALDKKGWLYEEIQGLTEAIDDLALLYDRMAAKFPKHPWNYVLLSKINDKPIYERMQFEILRNELVRWR